MSQYMIWSIYVAGTTNSNNTEDWKEDLSTDAPTGSYYIVFPYLNDVGLGYGLKVIDGKFDKESTLAAVKQARDDVSYWGAFLEGLTWDKDCNAFVASIGS